MTPDTRTTGETVGPIEARKIMKYEIIESPTNGTTGQSIGTFDYADLPARFQTDIDADETGEWGFPALSDGDTGDELTDLNVIVRSVAPTYIVTDGNAREEFETLVEAIECVEEWYDYMKDGGDRELPDFDGAGVTDVDTLNRAIGRWERAIAEACDVSDFAGHGNYYVTGADRMGLDLIVRIEE